ncbi:MAG TPA: hypothetical protein VNC40_11770 [Gaiellaceae bacterium]|nr:hypothetical protein [Gaiellaceae bacterium]
MATAVWIALVFCLVALVAGPGFAALRGLRAWRSFRSFSRATGSALDGVMRTAASAEEHAESLTAGAERLAGATQRLQASLAELGLLRAAAGETGAAVSAVRGAMPRK